MTKIIGLTGGIGSGKTTVANHFIGAGIPVYIADDEARKIMQSPEILREIDYFIRNDKHEKTQTMFESQETYEILKNPSNNEYGN